MEYRSITLSDPSEDEKYARSVSFISREGHVDIFLESDYWADFNPSGEFAGSNVLAMGAEK